MRQLLPGFHWKIAKSQRCFRPPPDECLPDEIFQLPHIPGKRDLAQGIQEVPAHLRQSTATEGAIFFEEMFSQWREVSGSFAQRRHLDR